MPAWAQDRGVSPKRGLGAVWANIPHVPHMFTHPGRTIGTLQAPEIPSRAHAG